MAQQYNNLFITLCVNLILFNAFYIVFAFVNNNNTNSDLCKTVGILLHFFLLSTFTLMLSLSLLRFILLFHVFNDMQRYNLIAISSSYGKLNWAAYDWYTWTIEIKFISFRNMRNSRAYLRFYSIWKWSRSKQIHNTKKFVNKWLLIWL